eukprot:8456255-Ditylum_brightwellii.AAC.1
MAQLPQDNDEYSILESWRFILSSRGHTNDLTLTSHNNNNNNNNNKKRRQPLTFPLKSKKTKEKKNKETLH